MQGAEAGGPVYESCFGTLTNSVGISTLDNPVYASRALNSRLLRMVQEAHSHIPVQKVDTRVTLAAEEESRAAKASRDMVQDRRRQSLVYQIYRLPPEKRKLEAARRPGSASTIV